MTVTDLTAECALGDPPRSRGCTRIDLIVVHRFGPSVPGWEPISSAADMARAFANHPELRGPVGRMAYSFVVMDDGAVQQAVALRHYTPHARAYNPRSVGIAALGDFRTADPSPRQWQSLVDLCALLMARFEGARVTGHHPWLPGGSADPDKVCPGDRLDLGRLHLEALQRLLDGGLEGQETQLVY